MVVVRQGPVDACSSGKPCEAAGILRAAPSHCVEPCMILHPLMSGRRPPSLLLDPRAAAIEASPLSPRSARHGQSFDNLY